MVELPQSVPRLMTPGSPFSLPTLGSDPLTLPSLSAGSPLLPSMDPRMDDDVASHYGKALIQQNAQQLQEMMVISGDYTATMRGNLAELNAVSTNLQQINALLSGAVQGLRQTGTTLLAGGTGGPGAGGQGGGAGPQMAPTGLTEPRAPGGGGSPSAPADTRTFSQRFTEARGQVQDRQSVVGVTRQMASRASDAMQSHTRLWDTEPDEDGLIHLKDQDGNILQSSPGTEENIARAATQNNRITRTTGLLNRYSAGESLLGGEGGLFGSFGTGVLKAAGPIGLAVGVADMGFKQFASQTAAGTQYRAAYGQDAGRFAISQRAGADMAGIGGYFSGVGFGQAKQNYEAAAGQGLTGDRLSEATGFMNDMYTKLGLDTQTSVQAVQISAQNTNISLSSLSDQIMAVSKAAVDAGKNSEVAVQSFLSVTSQVQQGVSNTAAAPVLAGQLSTAMSKNLATSLNTPQMASQFAGLITQQNIGMVAARTGQDFRSLSQEVATGQGGAAQSVVGQTLKFAIEDICRAGGVSSAALKADIQKRYPKVTNLAPNMQLAVLQDYPNLTPAIMVGIFGQYGLQVNPGDATTLFFNTLLSDLTAFGSTPGTGAKDPASAQQKGGASSILSGDHLSSTGMSALGLSTAPVGGPSSRFSGGGPSMAMGTPGTEYADYASSSGNRDLAIEALIKNSKKVTDFTGKGSIDDVSFVMKDGSNKSLADILKSPALLAQFDQGTPYVRNSKNPNDVLSAQDITGYGATPGGGSSQTGGSTSAGGFTISLTPEAQRLFNLTGPSDAQSQGVPPVGNATPYDYKK